MTKKFELSVPARQTLRSIGLYTEKNWGKKQRREYNKKFYYRFKTLAENPLLGRNCNYITLNMRSYPEGSHIIYYFVYSSHIEIADIVHQSKDAQQHFTHYNQ